MIRDQALAVSGLMAERLGGPPVKPYHPAGLYEQIVCQEWQALPAGQRSGPLSTQPLHLPETVGAAPGHAHLRRPVSRNMHRSPGPHIDASAGPQFDERPDLCRVGAVLAQSE